MSSADEIQQDDWEASPASKSSPTVPAASQPTATTLLPARSNPQHEYSEYIYGAEAYEQRDREWAEYMAILKPKTGAVYENSHPYPTQTSQDEVSFVENVAVQGLPVASPVSAAQTPFLVSPTAQGYPQPHSHPLLQPAYAGYAVYPPPVYALDSSQYQGLLDAYGHGSSAPLAAAAATAAPAPNATAAASASAPASASTNQPSPQIPSQPGAPSATSPPTQPSAEADTKALERALAQLQTQEPAPSAKGKTWASVLKQPGQQAKAKPKPPPAASKPPPAASKPSAASKHAPAPKQHSAARKPSLDPKPSPAAQPSASPPTSAAHAGTPTPSAPPAAVQANGALVDASQFNPPDFKIPPFSRHFVIKSYSEDDVHKSIKYGVWASTDMGNRRLDTAYRESAGRGPVYLFFSVNASGQFCGMAEMTSPVEFDKKMDVWEQDKWNGCFTVRWIFVKDIPNSQFRHIRLENNEGKPVTNSRDTQEVLLEPGREMLRIFASYRAKTSILDDFDYYERRAEQRKQRRALKQQQQQQEDAESSSTAAAVPSPSSPSAPLPSSPSSSSSPATGESAPMQAQHSHPHRGGHSASK